MPTLTTKSHQAQVLAKAFSLIADAVIELDVTPLLGEPMLRVRVDRRLHPRTRSAVEARGFVSIGSPRHVADFVLCGALREEMQAYSILTLASRWPITDVAEVMAPHMSSEQAELLAGRLVARGFLRHDDTARLTPTDAGTRALTTPSIVTELSW